jgi:hypothetical protein
MIGLHICGLRSISGRLSRLIKQFLPPLEQAKAKIAEVQKQLEERNKVVEEEPIWKKMGLPREPKYGDLMEMWDGSEPAFPNIERFDSFTTEGSVRSMREDGRFPRHAYAYGRFLELPVKQETPKMGLWVARDEDGCLYGYYQHPFRVDRVWKVSSEECVVLNQKAYPDLKWEDEPMEI